MPADSRVFFFFFQAEDGIRDADVTGVQTCALPICPLDMHFDGLERMGAEIRTEHGYIVAEAAELHGATIWLDLPSVGATENIVTAAVLAKGTTVLDNAAREPEIVDLCRMLQSMGAQIDGIGSSTLEITGVDGLHPTTHVAVPDRIVAGTWAFA